MVDWSFHTKFQLPRWLRSGSNILAWVGGGGSHSDYKTNISSQLNLHWTGQLELTLVPDHKNWYLYLLSNCNIFYGMTLYPMNNFDTFSEMLIDAFCWIINIVGLCFSHSIMLSVFLLLVSGLWLVENRNTTISWMSSPRFTNMLHYETKERLRWAHSHILFG